MATCKRLMLVALCLAATLPLAAQNSLTVGSNVVAFPAAQVQIPIFCTNTEAIHSLSVSLQHASVLEIGAGNTVPTIDFTGSVIDTVLSGGSPALLDIEYDPLTDEMTMGMILELMPMTTALEIPVSAVDQLLFNVVFDVPSSTNPGNYTIDLVNGLGDPPIDNTFSNMGTSTLPTLNSGSIDVQNANLFEIVDQDIPTSGAFSVEVEATHDFDTQGFQVSCTYDNTQLAFNLVTGIGTEAGDYLFLNNPELIVGNEPFELYEPNPPAPPVPVPGTNRSRIVFGAIYDLQSAVVLPPGTRSILRLQFTTLPGATSGSPTEIQFDTGPGDNFLVIAGQAITPIVDNAVLTFNALIELFVRSDANIDGGTDIADAVFVLAYLFNSGIAPSCFDAADCNDDSNIDISDAVYIVTFLFGGGANPFQPFPNCGVDPTMDAFDCAMYSCP
ncbi:MAG: hypothetical protein AAF581_00525 [Planctomycetota bacterium]